jgi:glycosyltransferase involved in cell wall biosynthesis
VTVITKPSRVEYLSSVAPKFNVVVTRVKEFTFAEQFGLLKVLRSLKPDLVFFPATQQPILYRGKVVTTVQDLTTARFRNPAKNWLVFTIKQQIYRQVIKIIAHKSAQLITPTEFVKDDLAKFARTNSRKITVTYEAADKINDKAESLEELEGKQFIMYVGRPQSHKNLDRLVEAFAVMRQSMPDLRLVFVGKKDLLYKRMARRVESQGLKNVIFTGFVSEGQLRWLYENTAAYVFPSLSEGFGLPPIEAMMHGAPVVSSNATCLPEVIQDAGHYFDPYDPEDMAAKIQEVISNPRLRKRLIQKGRKVSAGYSWKRMAEQTLAVYKEVLGL